MTVYKAFGPGMVCKEYHYKPGQVNAEAIANCARNGIRAAEDPLDCLSYYSWDGKNEFWRCEAVGDIDEDSVDSKISTTKLIPAQQLTLMEYAMECALYMYDHPTRVQERHGSFTVCKNVGMQSMNCIVLIVVGDDPKAKVTQQTGIVILVDLKNGNLRGIKDAAPGWYHITEEGVVPWTEQPRNI